jgi:multidrug efflux system membrane fusion protein
MTNLAKSKSSVSVRVSVSFVCVTFLLCLSLLIISGCGDTKKGLKKESPPIPVDLAKVIAKDTPFFIEAIGNVAAYNTVDVKSRVTGELTNTFFKAGDLLKVGQDLFTIDPAPFEAKVKESEAKLNQSKVQYDQAKREFLRFKVLYSEKAVSAEQLETKQVDMNSKLYQVDLIEAELASAKLNLGYCFIKSPLEGPSGERYIDNFNIVTANQDRLVTIKQVRPIKVKFSIPGKFLDEINRYNSFAPLEVEVFVLRSDRSEKGVLTLIDNNINIRTGMIALEGTLANPESRLWPGQFVDVRLYLTFTRGAVLVPERALNEGPEGKYVWIVNKDQTVAMRSVKMDRRYENSVVISEGLEPDENVVTDGQLMLRPGAHVVTRDQVNKMLEQKASPKGKGQSDDDKSKAKTVNP